MKQAIKPVLGNDGMPVQAVASFVAGFAIACTVAPFDMIRTRLMNQPVDGPRLYTSFLDCLVKIVRRDGPLVLWSGFVPMWGRVAPTAMGQLVVYEQITKWSGGKTL